MLHGTGNVLDEPSLAPPRRRRLFFRCGNRFQGWRGRRCHPCRGRARSAASRYSVWQRRVSRETSGQIAHRPTCCAPVHRPLEAPRRNRVPAALSRRCPASTAAIAS